MEFVDISVGFKLTPDVAHELQDKTFDEFWNHPEVQEMSFAAKQLSRVMSICGYTNFCVSANLDKKQQEKLNLQ